MTDGPTVCPEHGIPDCSPLLNGCSRPIQMHVERDNSALVVLEITWGPDSLPGLPTLVGPFDTDAEAQQWAELNVRSINVSNSARVRRVAYPYFRSGKT